jgi:hypothetical protein
MPRIIEAFTAKKLRFKGDFYIESDSDWKDGDWYCGFVQEQTGKEFDFRKTKTMQAANLMKGQIYTVETDYMGNPKFVSGNNREVVKYGGRIISHNLQTDKYYDETHQIEVDKKYKPLSGEKLFDGNRNYQKAALNKLMNGELTVEQLMKYNERGMFFSIRYIKPKDRRKSPGTSYGFADSKVRKNGIYLETDSKEDANFLLKLIRARLRKEVKSKFSVEYNIYSR